MRVFVYKYKRSALESQPNQPDKGDIMDETRIVERYLTELIKGLEMQRRHELEAFQAKINAKFEKPLSFYKSALDTLETAPDIVVPIFHPLAIGKQSEQGAPEGYPFEGSTDDKVLWVWEKLGEARVVEVRQYIFEKDPNPPTGPAIGTSAHRLGKSGKLEKVSDEQRAPYRVRKGNTLQPKLSSQIPQRGPFSEQNTPALTPAVKWALEQVRQHGHVVNEIDREIFRGIEELGAEGQRVNLKRRMNRNDVEVTTAQVGHRIRKYLDYDILDKVEHPTHFLKNYYRIAVSELPTADMFSSSETPMTENSNADGQGEKTPERKILRPLPF